MRKFLTFLSIVVGISAYGQTNTFPASGNVGIGTTNPISKLSIVLPVSTSNIGGDPNAYGATFTDNVNSTFAIRSLGNGVMHLATDGTGRKIILGGGNFEQTLSVTSGNNVGIGTMNPTENLSLLGNVGIYSGLNNVSPRPAVSAGTIPGEIRGVGSNAAYMDDGFLRLSAGGGTTATTKSYIDLSGYTNGIADRYMNIVMGTSGVERLRIDNAGNVGIGTINPTAKLAVAGTIQAYDIMVKTGWADYVFDSSYALRPLREVANYIQENKHLPNIPSAEEVIKNGIALGDMNKKFLEKIEELTLYTIQQNEKSKQQDEQIRDLKAQSEDVRQLKELLQKQSDLLEKQNKRIEQLERLVSQPKAVQTK